MISRKNIINGFLMAVMFTAIVVTPVFAALPPTIQNLEDVFIKTLIAFWGLFILDSLRFLVQFGLKYLFVWMGTADPNTDVMKEIKDKLGRWSISIVGVFFVPILIRLILELLYGTSSPADCYNFIQTGGIFEPVFQIVFKSC